MCKQCINKQYGCKGVKGCQNFRPKFNTKCKKAGKYPKCATCNKS